jgi:hypothetical protein
LTETAKTKAKTQKFFALQARILKGVRRESGVPGEGPHLLDG